MTNIEIHIDLDKTKALTDLANVVDKTNSIEFVLKQILTAYMKLGDDRAHIFYSIILHNSVIGLGQKFKIFHHIVSEEKWPSLDQKHFHNVLAIRNSFAHSDTDKTFSGVVQNSDGSHTVTEPYQIVDSLSSSGRYEHVERKDALLRFEQSAAKLYEYLLMLSRDYAVMKPNHAFKPTWDLTRNS